MKKNRVSSYVNRGRKRVSGWFLRLDAAIFATLMLGQSSRGVKGDSCEIGVHHGRSFILLNLCMNSGETAIAVDIFDNQEFNVEGGSGRGDYDKFNSNVARFGDKRRTRIIWTSSLDLNREAVDPLNRGLRFISIDGGHWYGAVLNDLRLAVRRSRLYNCA